MKVALEQIHGKYEDSFQLFFNWAAQIEKVSPGSLVEIELKKIGIKTDPRGCLLLLDHVWMDSYLVADLLLG